MIHSIHPVMPIVRPIFIYGLVFQVSGIGLIIAGVSLLLSVQYIWYILVLR